MVKLLMLMIAKEQSHVQLTAADVVKFRQDEVVFFFVFYAESSFYFLQNFLYFFFRRILVFHCLEKFQRLIKEGSLNQQII